MKLADYLAQRVYRLIKRRARQFQSRTLYSGGEHISDLASQIIGRLSAKAKKEYRPNTVLIINGETDGLIFADEWKAAIQQVEGLGIHKSFREVFLVASRGNHSACLWGSGKHAPLVQSSVIPIIGV
jgi:hypothetical protein